MNITYKFLIKLKKLLKNKNNNEIICLKQQNELILKELTALRIKLSMSDNVYANKYNIKFYLPNYPSDLIQNDIIENDFFELHILKELDNYIPKEATILDVGANIGNHSLYWASNGAKKIFSFEPVKNTFSILEKNIKLNNFENIIKPYNVGLSDKISKAKITRFDFFNIGGTNVRPSENGDIEYINLDSLNINEEKIDFLKIDVEGHEIEMLNGAIETIKKYKPIIFVEAFPPHQNIVFKILTDIGYKLEKTYYTSYNYLYVPN